MGTVTAVVREGRLRFSPPRVPKPYRARREDLLRQYERCEALMQEMYRSMIDIEQRITEEE